MDYNFLVFIYVGTIIFPGVLMAAFYAHIYTVVVKQLRQMVTVNGTTGGSGAMLRVLGAARKREVKATQNLSVIVLFFMICWFPLYTINFIKAFRPDFPIPILLNNFFIILTHLNSAGNPLLYAYHLRDFRAALRSLLIGSPEVKKKTGGKDNSAYLHDNDNVIDNKIKNKQIKHSTTMMALNKNKQVIRIIPSDRFELTPKTPHRIFNLSVDSSMDLIRNDKDKTNNTFCKETRFNYNVLEESISHTDGGTQKEPKVSEIIKKNISESPLQFMDEPGNDMSNKVYSLGLQPLSPVRKNLNNNNGIISIFKCNCMQSNKSSYSNNIEDRISISEQDDIYNNKKEKTSEVETCKLPTDESKKATNIGNDTSNKCKCTATKTEIINFDNYYEIKEKIVNRTETEINNTDKSDYDNISITSSSTVIITNNYDSSKKSDEKEKNVSVKCKNNKIKNIPLNEMYMTNTDRSGTISSSPTILSDVSNTSQTDNDVIKVHNEINFSDSEEYIPVDIKKVDKLQKVLKNNITNDKNISHVDIVHSNTISDELSSSQSNLDNLQKSSKEIDEIDDKQNDMVKILLHSSDTVSSTDTYKIETVTDASNETNVAHNYKISTITTSEPESSAIDTLYIISNNTKNNDKLFNNNKTTDCNKNSHRIIRTLSDTIIYKSREIIHHSVNSDSDSDSDSDNNGKLTIDNDDILSRTSHDNKIHISVTDKQNDKSTINLSTSYNCDISDTNNEVTERLYDTATKKINVSYSSSVNSVSKNNADISLENDNFASASCSSKNDNEK